MADLFATVRGLGRSRIMAQGNALSRSLAELFRMADSLSAARSDTSSPTLWVNSSTGDDSRSKATVAGSGGSLPWATIGRAAWGSTNFNSPNTSQAAAAGDVVSVAAGTYSTAAVSNYVAPSATRYTPVYLPANSGTSGSPIEFRASGTVILQTTGGQGSTIGALNQDYITWNGFTINEADAPSAPDTGPVTLWSTTGSIIEHCTINGDATYLPADNHVGIRLEHTQGVKLRYNEIANFFTGLSSPANGCAIETYWSGTAEVYRNYIHDCGTGVFLKANGDEGIDAYAFGPWDIYYNKITNCTNGIYFHRRSEIGSYKYRAWQNLLLDCGYSFILHSFGDSSDPRLAYFVNNTVVGSTVEDVLMLNLFTNAGHHVKNNIFVTPVQFFASEGVDATQVNNSAYIAIDRNVYRSPSVRFAQLQASLTTNYANYAAWSAAITQDANSSTSDPTFVGSGDYHLQGGSPALTLGRVVDNIGGTTGATIPAGCYISGSETIGV